MAQISKPAIPVNMYRHFAIVTLVVTGFLAVLTNSATPDDGATGETASSSGPPAGSSPRAGATPAYGESQFDTGSVVQSAEYAKYYGGAGGPGPQGSLGRGAVSAIGVTDQPAMGSENAGFTRDYLESLSDEELDQLLEQLRAGGVDDPATRRDVMAVLEAGARRRSGRATASE